MGDEDSGFVVAGFKHCILLKDEYRFRDFLSDMYVAHETSDLAMCVHEFAFVPLRVIMYSRVRYQYLQIKITGNQLSWSKDNTVLSCPCTRTQVGPAANILPLCAV